MSILAVALLLTGGALAAGCGGEAEGGNEAYAEILRGMREAAESGAAYDGADRAEDLEPALRASLDAFCAVNREMLANQEAGKAVDEAYLVSRIRTRAERELPFVSTGPVSRAVNRYRDLFALDSFDPSMVRAYAQACYG